MMKFTPMILIYALALSLSLHAETQSHHKHHPITSRHLTHASKAKNMETDTHKNQLVAEKDNPTCQLVVNHHSHPHKRRMPPISSRHRARTHLHRSRMHVHRRSVAPHRMPIERTVTLLPAIAPQENVSIVKKPAPAPTQIIVLPPASVETMIEKDKDASIKHRSPQTTLILKKNIPSHPSKKKISMLNPFKKLFSFNFQPQQLFNSFSFIQLINSPAPQQIEYLITIIGRKLTRHPTGSEYVLNNSIPLFANYHSAVDRSINMNSIKEATRVALLDGTLYLV